MIGEQTKCYMKKAGQISANLTIIEFTRKKQQKKQRKTKMKKKHEKSDILKKCIIANTFVA